ncbi:MAG: hypothetical protein ACKVPX_08420 [Myxococcaceae bacterium]
MSTVSKALVPSREGATPAVGARATAQAAATTARFRLDPRWVTAAATLGAVALTASGVEAAGPDNVDSMVQALRTYICGTDPNLVGDITADTARIASDAGQSASAALGQVADAVVRGKHAAGDSASTAIDTVSRSAQGSVGWLWGGITGSAKWAALAGLAGFGTITALGVAAKRNLLATLALATVVGGAGTATGCTVGGIVGSSAGWDAAWLRTAAPIAGTPPPPAAAPETEATSEHSRVAGYVQGILCGRDTLPKDDPLNPANRPKQGRP